MAIVVTGTSGQFGRATVEKLLERGVSAGDIVATARNTDKIADLAAKGVRTATLDYAAVPADVFGEGDVVVLVSGSEIGQRVPQHRNVLEAAKAAGVARIVYTSVTNVDTELVVAPEHLATEELITASGVPFTFLRNGWYTENYLSAFEQAKATSAVVSATGEGRVSSVERAELAEAAAVVASTEGHENKAYELVGETAWTHAELAEAFGEKLGTTVTYTPLTPEAYRDVLAGVGLDDGTIGFILTADANIADGLLGPTGSDLTQLLGRSPRTLRETVATWA